MKRQYHWIIPGVLLIVLLLSMGYFSFSVNDQLKGAIKTIEMVHAELDIARDSLSKAQNKVRHLALQLQQSEMQLSLIRSQVEVIDLNYKKNHTGNRKKLQELKQQLEEKEAAIAVLRQEAAKFEY